MVLGLDISLGALNSQPVEILAQARQRALVEKSGQVIRTVGQKLAAPDADEEVEKLTRDRFGDPSGRGLGQRCMRNTKRRCIPVKLGDASEQHRIRGTCQQSGEQRVFPRPRGIDLVGLVKIFAVRIQHAPSGAVCFVEPRVTHRKPETTVSPYSGPE